MKIKAKDKGKQGFIPRYSMVLPKFSKLHEVHIISCSKLLDLTWLIYAPCLQSLAVSACESMEELVCGKDGVVEKNSGLFSRLTTLQLENLPKLKRICKWVLPFPSLKMIYVCIPVAEQNWWEGLQWKDEAIKQRFDSFFMPSEYMDLYQVLGYGY